MSNQAAIEAMWDKIDNTLDGGQALEMRTCGVCGCMFLLSQEGDEYLWVDRYVAAGFDDHNCDCHELRHVGT